MRPAPPAGRSPPSAGLSFSLFWPALVVAALAIAVFLPGALTNGFAYDDGRFIVANPRVLHPTGWSDWLAYLHDPSAVDPLSPTGIVRPLRTLEFALDHAVFRLSPAPFHLHSLLWHVLACVLALALLREVGCGRAAAVAGAALFAVHPMQVESVAWISSRGDLAMGACTFGALLLALRSRGWDGALLAALVCGAFAMLYKETAVVLPLLVFAVRLMRPRDGRPGDVRGALRAAAPFVLVSAAYLAYRAAVQIGDTAHVNTFVMGGSAAGTFATMFRAIGAYALFLVLPVRPALDWYLLPSTSLLDIASLAWLAAHVAVIALAMRARTRQPLLAGAVCFFYFPLIPVANWPFQIGIATAERFLYVSVLAAALATAFAVQRLGRRATAPVALLVIACGALSFVRSRDWRDSESILAATHSHGGSPRAHTWRTARLRSEALAAQRASELDRAAELREEALVEAHAALLLLYRFEGTTDNRSHIVVEPHVNAADLCLALGRDVEALWHADRAAAAGGDLFPQIQFNRARALNRLERGAAAFRAMLRSQKDGFDDADPVFARVFLHAAHLAERDGLLSVAEAACHAALDVGVELGKPEAARARASLARIQVLRREARPEDLRRRLDAIVRTGTAEEWAAAGTMLAHEAGDTALLLRGICAEEAGDDTTARRLFEEWTARSLASDAEPPPPEAGRVALSLARMAFTCAGLPSSHR